MTEFTRNRKRLETLTSASKIDKVAKQFKNIQPSRFAVSGWKYIMENNRKEPKFRANAFPNRSNSRIDNYDSNKQFITSYNAEYKNRLSQSVDYSKAQFNSFRSHQLDRASKFPALPRAIHHIEDTAPPTERSEMFQLQHRPPRSTLGGLIGGPEGAMTNSDGNRWAGEPMDQRQKQFNRRRNVETEWQSLLFTGGVFK